MLQKAFFKTDVLNPTKITNVLIFSKNGSFETGVAYKFVVPEGYNNVVIEYAGGAGGNFESELLGGGGSIKKLSIDIAPGEKLTIEGIAGGCGSYAGRLAAPGGSWQGGGFSDGEQGSTGDSSDEFGYYYPGGGGGGSTSVVVKGITYEASGGGGVADYGINSGWGGKGGGQFGGARKYNKKTSNHASMKGNDATDPEQVGLNNGVRAQGYVKIYGNYDPYL